MIISMYSLLFPFKAILLEESSFSLISLSEHNITQLLPSLGFSDQHESMQFIENIRKQSFKILRKKYGLSDKATVEEQVIYDPMNEEFLYHNLTITIKAIDENLPGKVIKFINKRYEELQSILMQYFMRESGEDKVKAPLKFPYVFLIIFKVNKEEYPFLTNILESFIKYSSEYFPSSLQIYTATDTGLKPVDLSNPLHSTNIYSNLMYLTNISSFYILNQELDITDGTKIIFIVPPDYSEFILFKFSIPLFKLLYRVRDLHKLRKIYHEKIYEYIQKSALIRTIQDVNEIINLELRLENIIDSILLNGTQLRRIFSKLNSVMFSLRNIILSIKESEKKAKLSEQIGFIEQICNEVKESYNLIMSDIEEIINDPIHSLLASHIRVSNIRFNIVNELFKYVDLFIRSHKKLSPEVIDAINAITSFAVENENIYWNPVFNRCWFYVDHGLKHALRTVGKFADLITKLTNGRADLIYNDLEYLAVFIGVLFHDIGLFIPKYMECSEIRKYHGDYSFTIIYREIPEPREKTISIREHLAVILRNNLLKIVNKAYKPFKEAELNTVIDAILYIAGTIAKYHQSRNNIEHLKRDKELREKFIVIDRSNAEDDKWLHKAKIAILLLRIADESDLGEERAFPPLYNRVELLLDDEINALCRELDSVSNEKRSKIENLIRTLKNQYKHYRKSQFIKQIYFKVEDNKLDIIIEPIEDIYFIKQRKKEFVEAIALAYHDLLKEVALRNIGGQKRYLDEVIEKIENAEYIGEIKVKQNELEESLAYFLEEYSDGLNVSVIIDFNIWDSNDETIKPIRKEILEYVKMLVKGEHKELDIREYCNNIRH